MSLQGLKNLFGELRGKAGSLAIAGVASAAMLAANPVASEELPSYRDPANAQTAEELALIQEWNADIKAAKTRRDVRRHSYEHPQDIGVFLLRGDLDKNNYSDQQIEDALTKKILQYFSSLTWSTPGLHFESASGANKKGTVVLYYIEGEMVKCDLNGDGVNPDSENIFDVGEAISTLVLKALSDQYKKAN